MSMCTFSFDTMVQHRCHYHISSDSIEAAHRSNRPNRFSLTSSMQLTMWYNSHAESIHRTVQCRCQCPLKFSKCVKHNHDRQLQYTHHRWICSAIWMRIQMMDVAEPNEDGETFHINKFVSWHIHKIRACFKPSFWNCFALNTKQLPYDPLTRKPTHCHSANLNRRRCPNVPSNCVLLAVDSHLVR